jgi:hypothetical protein
MWSAIGTWFFELLLKDLVSFLQSKWSAYQAQKKIEADAKASVQPLKDATDGKGVDDGTGSALDHI